MRAAVLYERGATPEVAEFDDPTPTDGQVVVEVGVAGANPVDLAIASGAFGDPQLPYVVGREGVGSLADGRRVYFNSPSSPFGSWAPRTLVDPGQTFAVPDAVADGVAVAIGIAGLAAWVPLQWHARLRSGERVLVLGATGVVGQIAVQAARLLGAGRIVGAGRNRDALSRLAGLGADATVALGGDDDGAALKAEAGEGYDVVIDTVYGAPFLAALGATAVGARLVTIGAGAAGSAEVPFRDLQGRAHIGHGNQLTPREVLCDSYAQLCRHAAAGEIAVEIERFELDRAPQAWQAQAAGPNHKLVIIP
ncbi:MAG: quinone oxidoreductase family protein [Solirubrobacteraceae bacterium]